ncbi:MAG TPA: fumarylacetoacetate hydrolase family protein [Candidatus Kapabacteria bacterium]|jgi:fumarylacetoacetate (FAA) hydrolase|nr:fumarylacetoacetate hydrolase family protein [Candidatus Kapabacteria bacterium]
MKFVTFLTHETLDDRDEQRLGLVVGNEVVDLEHASKDLGTPLPSEIVAFLRFGEPAMLAAKKVDEVAASDPEIFKDKNARHPMDRVRLLAPVPRPTSMRDGYAFRQHVEAARRNRGVEMIPEFDQFPVFYFTNHQAVIGSGPMEVMPEHLNHLDFELEAAIVIGKQGKNIRASEADEHIAGYTIMNDWSARALQMEEMKLSLGPAKGKDFATAIGPYLVTRDALAAHRIPGEHGERYDLTMTASMNGKEYSRGNLKDMTWTFAQIIERASYGVTLYPGDVIGSGTVGTGCFLELNGSKITNNLWVQLGDTVTCAIEALGELTNTIVAAS